MTAPWTGYIFAGHDGSLYQAFMYQGKWFVDEIVVGSLCPAYREQ